MTPHSTSPPKEVGWRLAWWLVPILAWNVALMPYLPEGYAGDLGVPQPLLWFENVARLGVFAALFFLREQAVRRWQARTAVAVGVAVYFASWVPLLLWPGAVDVPVVALGPAVTPVLWLAGLGWLGKAPGWFVASLVFLAAHIAHQLVAS